ncbi:MAG: flagellar hook-basal body complex protein FliE [Vibrionaceae bacterium]
MKLNPILQQMQQMQFEAQNHIQPPQGAKVAQDFSAIFSSALNQVNALQQQSSDLSTRFDLGDRSVSLSDVMIARNKSSVAFDATIQTRNKLVEAYKELMNMPI